MSLQRPILPLVIALLATSCAAPATPPATTSPFGGPVTVTGKLDLRSAGGYQLLEEVSDAMRAWEAADVDHLQVFLKRGDGGEVDLGEHPDRSAPLVLKNLRMDTTYTVRLEAYTADDARIDDQTAACETTFTTTTDPTLELTGEDAFQIELADQTFAGQAAGNVAIADGALDDTEDDEELKLPPVLTFFDMIPAAGGGKLSELEAGARRITLPAGASKGFYSPASMEWGGTAGSFESTFSFDIRGLGNDVEVLVGFGTQAQAEQGDRAALRPFRIGRPGGTLVIDELDADGTTWVPRKTYDDVFKPVTIKVGALGTDGPASRTWGLGWTFTGDRSTNLHSAKRIADGPVALRLDFVNVGVNEATFNCDPVTPFTTLPATDPDD